MTYLYTKFHDHIITPSSKTTFNLNLNLYAKISKKEQRNSKSMNHEFKVIASFLKWNAAVHIMTYPYTKFHDHMITPS